eukprot:12324986-Alexandrium_andersonii.AAC.1
MPNPPTKKESAGAPGALLGGWSGVQSPPGKTYDHRCRASIRLLLLSLRACGVNACNACRDTASLADSCACCAVLVLGLGHLDNSTQTTAL